MRVPRGSNRIARVSGFACSAVFFACAGVTADGPRTMYRPGDIENARRNISDHRWAQEIFSEWRNGAEFALRQERAFFDELIPELTPLTHYGMTCPVCVEAGKRPDHNLRWNVNNPDQARCGACGTVYPHEDYPETLVLEAKRMGQTFTYYQTPAERALGPDASGAERAVHALWWGSGWPRATSFTGFIRYRRTEWAWRQALVLGKLYALTGNPAYAERAAWILDRFARVFPRYLYRGYFGAIIDWDPAQAAREMGSQGLRGSRYGGRFLSGVVLHAYDATERSDEQGAYSTAPPGYWGTGRLQPHNRTDAGPLRDLIIAYDLTRGARYADGTPVYTEPMHARIVKDLILAGAEDIEQWETKSNKGSALYSVSAAVGLLLEDPERMRRALWGFNLLLEDAYHFDGLYSQSPGYAAHNFGNLGGLYDLLYGYSDPPGYAPAEGARIDNLNPFADGRFQLVLQGMMRMLAPGNRMPVIGSTGSDRVISPRYAEIMAVRLGGPYPALLQELTGESFDEWGGEYSLWYRGPEVRAEGAARLPLRTEWFPGWHVGVLRGGRAHENDTALYLVGNENSWTIGTTHRHRDILSIIYYAFGREMIAGRDVRVSRPVDFRPVWGPYQLSHIRNLVVVDEQVQHHERRARQARRNGSHLELFGSAPGIELLQASGFNAYSQCDEYRRTLAQVRMPDGHHYAVDFFRVRGGKIHQYTLHSNGSLVGVSPAEAEFRPVRMSPIWQVWLDNAREVRPEEPYTFTWRYEDVNLDLMLLNASGSLHRIVVADALGEKRDPPGTKPPIQQIIAERRVDSPAEIINGEQHEAALTSRYAAVIVPYKTESTPVLAARLITSCANSGALAAKVSIDGRTDYIVSALDGEKRSYGPVATDGRFAFVSVDDGGRVVKAYLLGGTELEYNGGRVLELPAAFTVLKVESVAGRTFHLAEALPAGVRNSAWFALADGPEPLDEDLPRPRTGFEIESVTARSITVRDYPVVDCDEVTLLHAAWMGPDR